VKSTGIFQKKKHFRMNKKNVPTQTKEAFLLEEEEVSA